MHEHEIDEVWLRNEVTRVYRAAKRCEPRLDRKRPMVKFDRFSGRLVGQVNYWPRRIRLFHVGYYNRKREYWTDVIVHEIAHFMNHERGGRGHDDWFRAAQNELRYELGLPKKVWGQSTIISDGKAVA